ncbi:hypothetical protein GCM10020331_047050 [Ectobacillus funiculus]
MRIASVIVDVPARQTDRPFDYLIPERWEDLVVPGMRVAVPFGPRKLQGFVIAVKDTVDVDVQKNKRVGRPAGCNICTKRRAAQSGLFG